MFDRLVPVEQGEGVVLLIRREVHIDQDGALSIVDEPVGYFFPESSVDDKESHFSTVKSISMVGWELQMQAFKMMSVGRFCVCDHSALKEPPRLQA